MQKKGFTLVELLAVIAILATIMVIGTISIGSVSNKANKNMLENIKDSIVNAAIYYGQENSLELNETCIVNDKEYSNCKKITVKELLEEKYLISNKDNNNFINPVTKENMENEYVTLYKEYYRVYADSSCLAIEDESC